MYDHIGLKVANLEAAVRFYRAALAPLGYVVGSDDAACAGLGPEKAPAFWLYAANGAPTAGAHVAFRAADRETVDRFHAAGRKSGGRDNGKPGLRADCAPTHYAAFLLDPDGNNVEVVCLQ